ncbi:MAG: dienelactone hydrolase family protein [Phycisphaerae bacterium]
MVQAISSHLESIEVRAGAVALKGDLAVPEDARALVIFAHGSGSGRASPRNRAVAGSLNAGGLATLLVDLLTPGEREIDDRTMRLRFDIPLLANRVIGAIDWAGSQEDLARMQVGLYGASTGAAAAIVAAAQRADRVGAIVSRGGRPDLAAEALPNVKAPLLLIVGSLDGQVINLNRYAQGFLHCENRLEIVPGTGHLFEEPGKIEEVSRLAGEWFRRHLA